MPPAMILRRHCGKPQLATIHDRRTRFGGSHPIYWAAFHVATHVPPVSDLTSRDLPPKAAVKLVPKGIVPAADGATLTFACTGAEWLPDGKVLVVGTESFYVCDLERREVLRLDSAGLTTMCAVAADGRWVTRHAGGQSYLWNVNAKALAGMDRNPLEGDLRVFQDACFSADGKWMALRQGTQSVRIAAVNDPTRVAEILLPSSGSVSYSPRDIKLTSDGGRLLVNTLNRRLTVFDVTSKAAVAQWDVEGGEQDLIWTTCVTSDDKHVVVACGSHLRLHDLMTGKVVREYVPNAEAMQCIRLSPDGRNFAVGTGLGVAPSPVLEFDVSKSEPRRRLEGLGGPAYSVAYSQDGKRIAATAGNKGTRIWDLNPLDR